MAGVENPTVKELLGTRSQHDHALRAPPNNQSKRGKKLEKVPAISQHPSKIQQDDTPQVLEN